MILIEAYPITCLLIAITVAIVATWEAKRVDSK
jgi:hypothetical protein